jgi:hypothetical protein
MWQSFQARLSEPTRKKTPMRRQPSPTILRLIFLSLALLFATSTAFADARSEARTHYQAGVKFYNANDYRSAIREFSAAQQLMPADLNNYNLALCYDKLGDAEPAVQYYRAFLDKQPNSDKRAEIEASIARLDGAAKSAAAKKAEEARRAEEARKEEAARAAAAAAAARKAEEARAAAEAAKRPAGPPDTLPDPGPEPVGGSSIGTPSTGTAVSTGDAQLDRVQSISIDQVRDERMGASGSGMVNTPPPAPPGPNAGMAPTGPTGPNAGMPANTAGTQPMGPQDQPKKADPVYKKWWFWAIVVVGAYVVYQIATEDSSSDVSRTLLPTGPAAQPNTGGATLWRF